MFTTRKFFDIAAPESTPSVASLMAKSGVRTGADSKVEIPSVIPEKKETPETPAEPAIPVETTTLATPAETVKPQTPTPSLEVKPQVSTPQKEDTPKAEPQWQEVLKKQQPDAVFKAMGLDDKTVSLAKKLAENPKILGLINHWEDKGDVKAYLQALSTDYKAMKPEEVMRHQLREANPDLDEKQLSVLYKRKVIDRYKLDPDIYSPDEVEEGRIELMADARPIRLQLEAEQEKFFIPPAPEKEPQVDVFAEQQRKEAETIQELKRVINADPYYRDVMASKKLKFGEGDDAFSLSVKDPEEMLNILYNKDELNSRLFDPETELPNMETQLTIAAILKVGAKKFFKDLGKHYLSLGGKSVIDPIENPSMPGQMTSPAQAQPQTMAEYMAKQGKKVSGSGD